MSNVGLMESRTEDVPEHVGGAVGHGAHGLLGHAQGLAHVQQALQQGRPRGKARRRRRRQGRSQGGYPTRGRRRRRAAHLWSAKTEEGEK